MHHYKQVQSVPSFCRKFNPLTPWNPRIRQTGKDPPTNGLTTSRADIFPGREIAIDEAMIKFKECSSLKQKKPIKRGIKVWCWESPLLAIFQGWRYTRGHHHREWTGGTSGSRSKRDFEHRWYRCIFDNYFTSKRLICELMEVGIYGCGTCRKNRKLFPELLKKPKRDVCVQG